MHGQKDKEVRTILAAALDGTLTKAQAERLAAIDPQLLTLALLAAAKRIAELRAKLEGPPRVDPSTPSGQRPVYTKPPAPKRKGKPGAKKGHKGTRRAKPEQIDRTEEHHAGCCPDCGCQDLTDGDRERTRTIEDICEDLRTAVTEHVIHGSWCPVCKKYVEPVVPDALPRATIGHRLVVLTAWLHYGVGVTIGQLDEILHYHLRTHLSAGGMIKAWQKLAEILERWYEQIAEEARQSAVLHADETGWRVNGQTWWLWCFATKHVCFYMIDRCRGSPALERFFIEALNGVLVTDFWAAYNALRGCVEDRQCCLAHLLRELEKVDQRNDSAAWRAFAKTLRRLIGDAIRLRKRPDFDPQRYASRIRRIDQRLMELARGAYADADASRLAKRLLKHSDELFTFLDTPGVPFDNNLAERMIRPAVILRKNSQSNRSEKGAATQAVLMSVFRTLKLRGHDPLKVIPQTLRTYLTTGKLPPLPGPAAADG
jgi:transposase